MNVSSVVNRWTNCCSRVTNRLVPCLSSNELQINVVSLGKIQIDRWSAVLWRGNLAWTGALSPSSSDQSGPRRSAGQFTAFTPTPALLQTHCRVFHLVPCCVNSGGLTAGCRQTISGNTLSPIFSIDKQYRYLIGQITLYNGAYNIYSKCLLIYLSTSREWCIK